MKTTSKNPRRKALSVSDRKLVFQKTDGHCHICGGWLKKNWTADHIVSHMRGGVHAVSNYLPACTICNRLRWKYHARDIKKILQLGIYARHEIRLKTELGKRMQALYRQRREQNKGR